MIVILKICVRVCVKLSHNPMSFLINTTSLLRTKTLPGGGKVSASYADGFQGIDCSAYKISDYRWSFFSLRSGVPFEGFCSRFCGSFFIGWFLFGVVLLLGIIVSFSLRGCVANNKPTSVPNGRFPSLIKKILNSKNMVNV